MTGSPAAAWTIFIVVSIVLAGWLIAVMRADTHPKWKHHSNLPKYEVTGGAFQAVDGGRQLMPLPGERPVPVTEEELARARADIPAQRTSAQQPAPAGATAASATAASAAERDETGERHQVAGSKLR
jgi:hypothetical protein